MTYDTSALEGGDVTLNLALDSILTKKTEEGEAVPTLFNMISKQKDLESQMKQRKSTVGDTPAISAIEGMANTAMKQLISSLILG